MNNLESNESQKSSRLITKMVDELPESVVLANKESLYKFDAIRKSILGKKDLARTNPEDTYWIKPEIASLKEELDELVNKSSLIKDITQILSVDGYNQFIKYFREKCEQLSKQETTSKNDYKEIPPIKPFKVDGVADNVLETIKSKEFPERKSVDISSFEVSEKEINDYNLEHLCYKDAFKETGREMNKEIAKKSLTPTIIERIKLMKYLSENVENFDKNFNETIEKINDKFEEQFKKVISTVWKPSSKNYIYENGYEYSRDRSWIKWDIAKQLNYFLNKNTSIDNKYIISNPLTDEKLQQEIIDRMIGWNYIKMIDLLEEAGFEGVKSISIKEKNDGGDKISSKGLTEIGNLLRRYT